MTGWPTPCFRRRIALPIFASDALSSVAYAPDEILLTLALAGVSAVAFSPWVGLAVMVVLLTVVASYRQNVHAYPSGGGDYEIANENLGKYAGLTVASALLVDYVLTVAVSMSSAAAYLTTAVPSLCTGSRPLIATIGVDHPRPGEPPRHQGGRQRLRRAHVHLYGLDLWA